MSRLAPLNRARAVLTDPVKRHNAMHLHYALIELVKAYELLVACAPRLQDLTTAENAAGEALVVSVNSKDKDKE